MQTAVDLARSGQTVGRSRRKPMSWIALVAIIVSLLSLLPLAFIIWIGVQIGWDTASALVFRPRVGELLVNTVLLVALTVPIATVLSVTLAWLTERSDLPGARLWAWLSVAPLAIPAFVHSYAWITLVPGLHGLWAGVLVSVLAYFPFLYLPLAAALRRLDPALEDAAAALGLGPWRVFWRVVLPQLRLAICGGALLVGLHLLAEYGLYVFIRFDTFTTAIVDQFQSTFNGPAANMLAGVLVTCCFVLLALEVLVRGEERYARVGSGAARHRQRSRLGRATLACLALPAVTTLLAIGVPFVTIGRWLVAGGADVWRLDEIGLALGQTLFLALAGALLATIAAMPMAWISIRAPGPLQRLLEGCNYIVGSLPGVVIALALVTITVRIAMPLYQTLFTILVAYALMFLPRALISLRASIAQAPVELERAAASLGRPPLKALWSTTIRLSAPGAAAGMALVALGIMNELTATQMLAPNGTRTLAMAFWSYSGEIDYASAAPYAFIMVAMSLPLTWLLYVQSKRMAGR
ncbi:MULTISPECIES: iron ABC transporter permease [unclassified Mesorhizobium]|uniref:ABC transporter permease n=1 Tax=unclassified Mesorhizobium TaxID=325217 RepID=UPI0003CDD641|nr:MULTISPECIES: iron ABC transporter permease [unclassified Mesorhizobium]ESW63856.1 iron ABC transporter permease [Mesorhizobium sp. LSJC277A00]ESX22935.1 iron ABC transporter permease [Mesorhizobium sp. LSJC264A00]ESX60281.1 iron ABC transporter permease [Mesorhizobium sp. LSHC422A00]ESY39994.1 iron ABC transporter permease [Mesorhizobium sp. LNJC384A00]ESY52893.1 iron ABC transporter permease [Mesorhizobium sp. LNJC372A00]